MDLLAPETGIRCAKSASWLCHRKMNAPMPAASDSNVAHHHNSSDARCPLSDGALSFSKRPNISVRKTGYNVDVNMVTSRKPLINMARTVCTQVVKYRAGSTLFCKPKKFNNFNYSEQFWALITIHLPGWTPSPPPQSSTDTHWSSTFFTLIWNV